MYREDTTVKELRDWLEEEFSIKTTTRTIERRLKKWGVRKQPALQLCESLRNRIINLFFDAGLEDEETLRILCRDSWNVVKWTLVRFRRECGLKRRIGRSAEEKEEADRVLRQLLKRDGVRNS